MPHLEMKDYSALTNSDPRKFPTELLLCPFGMLKASDKDQLEFTPAYAQALIDNADKMRRAGEKNGRIAIHHGQPPRDGHNACCALELRDSGLWGVDIQWHDGSHLAYTYLVPVIGTLTHHEGAHLLAVHTTNRPPVPEFFPIQPWALDPAQAARIDYAEALVGISQAIQAVAGCSMPELAKLEERINTHIATMRVNAEIADGLAQRPATGAA